MISTEIGSACVFFNKSKPNHIIHLHIFHYISNDTNVFVTANLKNLNDLRIIATDTENQTCRN